MSAEMPRRFVSVGFDCHKGQHTMVILDPEGRRTGPKAKIQITKAGFDHARNLISAAKIRCNAADAKIGVEATSFYHLNIVSALKPFYDDIRILNPKLLTVRHRGEIRNKKSDQKDAKIVAAAVHDGIKGSMPYNDLALMEIQEMLRFRSRLKKYRSNLKKRFRRNLHVLFPRCDIIVRPFMKTSFALLSKYPSAEHIRKASFEELKKATQRKGMRGIREKTLKKLVEAAKEAPDCPIYRNALLREQKAMVRLIRSMDHEIEKLSRKAMKAWRALGIRPRFFDLEGMTEKKGVEIYAEVQDVTRFPTVDTFVAFLGLDPRTKRTDKREKHGRLTKMGTRYGRETLGNFVLGMRKTNPAIKAAWLKARAQKRPWNECRVICMRKLARMIWGIERNSK